MSRHDYLAPEGKGGKLKNFIQNLAWSIVWLGRWTIRLLKKGAPHWGSWRPKGD